MSLPYCFRSQLFRSGSATGQQCTHCGIGAVPWCVVLVPPIRMGCRPPPFAQCVCQYQVFFEKNLGTKKNQRKAQKSMSEKSLFFIFKFHHQDLCCAKCARCSRWHTVYWHPLPQPPVFLAVQIICFSPSIQMEIYFCSRCRG